MTPEPPDPSEPRAGADGGAQGAAENGAGGNPAEPSARGSASAGNGAEPRAGAAPAAGAASASATAPPLDPAAEDGAPPSGAALEPDVNPDGSPRWKWWFAPVGFLGAAALTLFLSSVIGLVALVLGADLDDRSPELTFVVVLAQHTSLIATALLLARITLPPRPWHFGLRPTPIRPALAWTVLGFLSFLVFSAIYQQLANLGEDDAQTTLETLGVDESTLALVLGAVLVVLIAPVAEELFFRGFFYRALRLRFGIWPGAIATGLFFGAIHLPTGAAAVPAIAFLGLVLCLLYERTGSLYPPILLHAANNAIAYGSGADAAVLSAGMAGALGLGVAAHAAVSRRGGRAAAT